MTGIQTNFTAADMLGSKQSALAPKPAAPNKPFFAPVAAPAPEPVLEVVEEDVVSDDEN